MVREVALSTSELAEVVMEIVTGIASRTESGVEAYFATFWARWAYL
jgi:hypothetical protein